MVPTAPTANTTLPLVMRSGSKVWASAMLTLPRAWMSSLPAVESGWCVLGLTAPKTCAEPLARRSVSGPVMWTWSSVARPLRRPIESGPAALKVSPWEAISKLENCA